MWISLKEWGIQGEWDFLNRAAQCKLLYNYYDTGAQPGAHLWHLPPPPRNFQNMNKGEILYSKSILRSPIGIFQCPTGKL